MSRLPQIPARWCPTKEAANHSVAIVDVLETLPMAAQGASLVVFALIGTADVLPFLVAVKSLSAQLGRGRVAVLDDGTLTAQDRAILAHHCADPEIIRLGDVQHGLFPQGEAWAQLLTILDRRASEYWVQLDPASVTLGPVPEVAEAIARNRSFLCLAGGEAGAPQPLASFRAQVYPDGAVDDDAAAQTESRLDMIGGKNGWRYARAAEGAAGFSALGADRALVTAFEQAVRRSGSKADLDQDQIVKVARNFILANEKQAEILPADRYVTFDGANCRGDAAFVHFPAKHRYKGAAYLEASRRAIETLKR